MMMKWLCCKWLLLALCCYFALLPAAPGSALPYTIPIGGLFDESDPYQELVFKLAIQRINEGHVLGFNKLQSHVQKVDSKNIFAVSQTVCSILNTGVVGLFGPNAEESSNYVQSICDTMEIPHIETRWDSEQQRGNCLVNLYPHPSTLALGFAKLVKQMEWKSFVILYQDSMSMPRIAELLNFNDKKEYTIVVRQLSPSLGDNFRKTFKDVRTMGINNFVIDCDIDILDEVLKQAQQLGLMTDQQSFIITNLDMHTIDLAPYQWGGSHITGLRLIDPESHQVQEIARELDTLKQELRNSRGEPDDISPTYISAHKLRLESALLIDAVMLFSYALRQLNTSHVVQPKQLFCNSTDNWEQGYSIINYMKTHTAQGLTGLIKFDNEGFRTDFVVDIVDLREGGIIKIGHWNTTEEDLYINSDIGEELFDADDPLRNKTLRILICLTEPYGMLKEDSKQLTGNDRFEGFGIDLIDILSQIHGFKYIFQVQEDGANGSWNNITGWNGMIRELLDNRSDLAITDFTITSERERAVDFTHPFMNLGIQILFKKPKPQDPSFLSFAAPFSWDVWATLGGAYIGVSLIFFMVGRLCPDEWNNPFGCVEEPEYLYNQFSLKNSFWFTMGTLMQQGSEVAPCAPSTRMVAGLWWFFALIMVSSYTANLAACLTVETLVSPFTNVDGLAECVEKGEVVVGAKGGGATANFFRDSIHPTNQIIWKFMNEHPEAMVSNNTRGIERAESNNEQYAFMMESTSIEYQIERHCSLTAVGDKLDNKGYGIAMRKNSEYRNALSSSVVNLQESGKIDVLKNKWWAEKRGGGACVNEKETAALALTLKHVGGVFFVLVAGTFLALVLVMIEMIVDIMKKCYKYKVSFKDELKEEVSFFLNFNAQVKPVRIRKSQSHSQSNNSAESNHTLADAPSIEFQAANGKQRPS